MDEAQRIKNWRTKIASAVKTIPAVTPLCSPEPRWKIAWRTFTVSCKWSMPRCWGRFGATWSTSMSPTPRGKVLGYRNLSLLRRRLAPVMMRRDRRLVRDQLPERINQRIDVAMTAKQVDLHDAAMAAAGKLASIAKRRPLTPVEQNRLMAALQQARMACSAAAWWTRKLRAPRSSMSWPSFWKNFVSSPA